MKHAAYILMLFAVAVLDAADYRLALPGYRYEFPRDHFNHPDFRTEWWYYTGNLESSEGRRFGFELTFFRQATQRPAEITSVWQVNDVWLAHLALTDVNGDRFYHEQRLNRSGGGFAGASLDQERVWNGNWQVQWTGQTQNLQAISSDFALKLTLAPAKPPVMHGKNGVSQKAAGEGRASHYISLTRLNASGVLSLGGKAYTLRGAAWMDHEFFTHQLDSGQIGWDWLSIQLDDNTELMLFRLRRKDGTVDPFSAGTFVDAAGKSRFLTAADFKLTPLDQWQSSATNARYPIHWRIDVPLLALTLDAATLLPQQELVGKTKLSPTYWEGAMEFTGTRNAAPLHGRGYLEMTGYNKAINLSGSRVLPE